MAKQNILYLLLLGFLFFCFISVLDQKKAKADNLVHQVSYDVLKYEWVVAEAIDINTAQDLTNTYKSSAIQFLSSGGFVEYQDRIIHKTGSWKVKNDRITIVYDGTGLETESYQVELVRPEEMILLNDHLQLRMLRVQL